LPGERTALRGGKTAALRAARSLERGPLGRVIAPRRL